MNSILMGIKRKRKKMKDGGQPSDAADMENQELSDEADRAHQANEQASQPQSPKYDKRGNPIMEANGGSIAKAIMQKMKKMAEGGEVGGEDDEIGLENFLSDEEDDSDMFKPALNSDRKNRIRKFLMGR
jgi:flagellar motor protein MotB